MKKIVLRAPATSGNVGPGYDIFAMSLSEPWDEFEISINDSDKINIEILNNQEKIPVDIMDNTAGLAISELCQQKKIQQGINIKIIKKMPSGCGLGSTGASAVACIFGLNKLCDLNLSDNEIIDLARKGEVASGGSPHADNVAAALLGGFVLVRSYNPIDVLKLEIPEFPVVLAILKKSQRTTRGYITYDIGQEKLKEQMSHCSGVIHSILTNNIVEFGKAINTDHIAEPVRGAAIPNYKSIKQNILKAGALGLNISGGGSSVFAMCHKKNQDNIAEVMEKEFSNNSCFDKVIKTTTSNNGIKILSNI